MNLIDAVNNTAKYIFFKILKHEISFHSPVDQKMLGCRIKRLISLTQFLKKKIEIQENTVFR